MIALRRPFRVPLPSGRVLELGARTLVMAIVNVTPDSFADGGVRFDPDIAIRDALQMAADGADVIDVGGESTRPGAVAVSAAEQWRRVGPVLEGLRGRLEAPVSIDTSSADVARRALDLGAEIVNDVTALAADAALAPLVADRRAAIVLMHNRGPSDDMYARARYGDVAEDIAAELAARDAAARAAGIAADRIILDPGLGFAKRAEQTLAAIAGLPRLAALGRPLLSGPSRKSFLNLTIGDRAAEDRVFATAAAVAASALLGAHLVRVHDVKPMIDVVRVVDRIRAAAGS